MNIFQVLVLDGNLDMEKISAEYIRSEGRILNPVELNNKCWSGPSFDPPFIYKTIRLIY